MCMSKVSTVFPSARPHSPALNSRQSVPLNSRLVSHTRWSSFTKSMTMTEAGKSKFRHLPLSTKGPLPCALKGTVLLNHPFFNKGCAFTKEERHVFGLHGLLPQSVQTLEQQAERAYQQYSRKPDDLAKNTFLSSLKEQNEVLYFKVRYTTYPQVTTRIVSIGSYPLSFSS